jgi:sialate O-acetylesterase
MLHNGQDLVYSGPIYDSMTAEENNIRIKFKNLGSGMTLASSPAANSEILPTSTELTGFGIADGQNPYGNFYNKQGLPASPFRTDDWPPPSR